MERGYEMALERERTSRDYLYGRLLALAEHLEARALYVGGEQRETNAARLMQRFAERPYTTWRILEPSLQPYQGRLQAKRPKFLHYIKVTMDDVVAMFATEDFISDAPLSGEFLLGYHCQRAALRRQHPEDADDSNENE
jgi:CRISPR-associated protein Csd1